MAPPARWGLRRIASNGRPTVATTPPVDGPSGGAIPHRGSRARATRSRPGATPRRRAARRGSEGGAPLRAQSCNLIARRPSVEGLTDRSAEQPRHVHPQGLDGRPFARSSEGGGVEAPEPHGGGAQLGGRAMACGSIRLGRALDHGSNWLGPMTRGRARDDAPCTFGPRARTRKGGLIRTPPTVARWGPHAAGGGSPSPPRTTRSRVEGSGAGNSRRSIRPTNTPRSTPSSEHRAATAAAAAMGSTTSTTARRTPGWGCSPANGTCRAHSRPGRHPQGFTVHPQGLRARTLGW